MTAFYRHPFLIISITTTFNKHSVSFSSTRRREEHLPLPGHAALRALGQGPGQQERPRSSALRGVPGRAHRPGAGETGPAAGRGGGHHEHRGQGHGPQRQRAGCIRHRVDGAPPRETRTLVTEGVRGKCHFVCLCWLVLLMRFWNFFRNIFKKEISIIFFQTFQIGLYFNKQLLIFFLFADRTSTL